MAIRFMQKHIEELPLGNLTTGQFFRIATEASKALGWAVGNVNETGLIAYTNNGLFSWNAEVIIKVKNGSANLLSRSRNPHVIEFGRDKENLLRFISTFNDLKKQFVPQDPTSQTRNLQPRLHKELTL